MNMVFLASLLAGLGNTVLLSVLTFLTGGALGLFIALGRISPSRTIRRLAISYVEVLQGIPLLVLLGFAFFGPNVFGFDSLSPLGAAVLAFALYASAYLGEIWRGCLQAVPKQQWEGAETLGLSRLQRMRTIILPQAARIAIPPTVGFMVQIVKNTSVASLVVGFAELSYNAKVINNSTFRPFLYFGLAALLYFIVCYPLSVTSRILERRLRVGAR